MKNKGNRYSIFALLWVKEESEALIHEFLASKGIPRRAFQKETHLTVYHGRRPLQGISPYHSPVEISADVSETRFMVMAPGGENPRPELDPKHKSVGIRLKKTNRAIAQIQELRARIYRLETPKVIGTRRPTTAWTNCFGARHYQPHIKLIHPGSNIDRDLTPLGNAFRSSIESFDFDRFEIRCGLVQG